MCRAMGAHRLAAGPQGLLSVRNAQGGVRSFSMQNITAILKGLPPHLVSFRNIASSRGMWRTGMRASPCIASRLDQMVEAALPRSPLLLFFRCWIA